jgi:uncharacterized protein YegJ (DUF2314 family)
VLRKLLGEEFSPWSQVKELKQDAGKLTLSSRAVADVKGSYAPPSMEALNRFGRGISRDQATALQGSQAAFVVDFTYGQAHVWDGLLSAYRMMERLARETGGLIWDEETREIFSPDAWNERRIAAWKSDVPDISRHTVIHAYKKDTLVRAITLGMVKFGLPDLVVDQFSWDVTRNMGILLNLFGQAIAEGAGVERPGAFTLDLKKIRSAEVREPQLKTLKDHATGVVELELSEGILEDGDPRNRLIEIGFDRYAGPDVQARQEKLLSDLFGWTDTLATVSPSQALKDASERARALIPKLRSDFNAGLQPGELIMVKAPFVGANDRKEYMWIEVISWDGARIKGLLRSEPFYVTGLHAGQTVDVEESTIYDYIRKRPDGSQEGNETGKVIEAQGAAEETR